MKWWLKLGLALILVVVIAVLGISGFLGYSMTKARRVPIDYSKPLKILKTSYGWLPRLVT